MHTITRGIWQVCGVSLGVLPSLAIVLFGLCAASQGGSQNDSGLGLDDIRAAIEASRSKVKDISVEYSVDVSRTDFFYVVWKQRLDRKLQAGVLGSKPDPRRTTPPEKHDWDKYRLLVKGDQLAYTIFDRANRNAASPRPVYEAVFSNGIETFFEPLKKRGGVHSMSRKDVVPFFQVEDCFKIAHRDLLEYLGRKNLRVESLSMRSESGSTLVDLHTSISNSSLNATWVEECAISFDAGRDFWPVRITQGTRYRLPKTSSDIRTAELEVIVNGFRRIAGVSYPASIVRNDYGTETTPRPGSRIPEPKRTDITVTTAVNIETVDINRGLADSNFRINFPPGTTYLDTRDGEMYVVDPAGTVTKLVNNMQKLPLPYNPATKEDMETMMEGNKAIAKFEAAKQHSAVQPASRSGSYKYLLVLLLAILLGVFTYRRIRSRAPSPYGR